MTEVMLMLQQLPPTVEQKHVKPFVKWIGGKRQLMDRIIPMLPEIDVFHEPFLGGGKLFFELRSMGLIRESAYLSDVTTELITAYRIVQSQPQELMAILDSPMFVNSKSNYLRVRALNPARLAPLEVAARLIFLNKTCYNGLYRVNLKGQFNAAWYPSSVKRRVYDPDVIEADSLALEGVNLSFGDFESVLAQNIQGINKEFVFFDPPYWDSYTAYTGNRFEWKDHERLFNLAKKLGDEGIQWMLCNSDNEAIWELYDGYNIIRVGVNYLVNTDIKGRKGKTEVIITNYDV